MCGIAGIVGGDSQVVVNSHDIDRMCQAIVHRGPDDQGMYVRGSVGLGMRRLSIIDLATGRQPIHNEDESVWVVFNGEIYNYPEVRRDLESRGHRFYTNSDTEVIPHLYEEFGADFVHKLRGMFAIALYDERRRKLLLARDRLGKKPLLYTHCSGRLLFASEIRSMLVVAPELAELNQEALVYYFQYGYIPDPYSAFSHIKRLPPGHILEFENNRIKVSRYWDIPGYTEESRLSENEWLDKLEAELAESVRMRLISDVPIGALLSGGVDSSLVVGLMSRYAPRLRTFSIAFGNEDFNEGQHARAVAQRFGTQHHELTVEPRFEEVLDKLTHLLEEPFGDSSAVPTYYVSRLVREHVTVALSGDGGDEMFAGYQRYQINLNRERFRFIPAAFGRFYRGHVFPRLPESTRGRKFLYNVSLPFEQRYIDSMSFLCSRQRERSLFSDDFLACADRAPDPQDLFEAYFAHAPAAHPLSRMQYLDTKTYLPGDVLTKVDRMSMAASLEVRAPLLDHVFAELAAHVPAEWKLRDGEGKYLLKKLAIRVGVPASVVYRPKQGFAVPLVHWLRNELKAEVTQILTEARTVQRGYFSPAAVRRLVDEHISGRRDRSADIWLLLMFELWHRNFLEHRESALVSRPPEINVQSAAAGDARAGVAAR